MRAVHSVLAIRAERQSLVVDCGPATLLYAPFRGIVKEIAHLVREEKGRRGILESRPHPEKIGQYLDVWDREKCFAAAWEVRPQRGSDGSKIAAGG